MLKFIRRNASAWWVKVMFILIVVVFMTWGVGAVISSGGDIVARVNGENIDPAQYERAYQGMLRFYQNLYKDSFSPEIMKAMNLPARTVDQLINSSVMRQEAERLGLTTTDEEVRQAIASNEAFLSDGVFNRDLYVRVLRSQRPPLAPAEFEESQREEILISKLRDLITAGVQVGEADVRTRFEYDNEKVNLAYVKVDPDQFLTGIEISEEQLKEFYEAHTDEFRLPERVVLEYVVFPNAHFEATIEIPEAEARQYYDEHQDEFRQEEQVRARHILIRVEEGADETTKAAARQRIEEVHAKAKAGEDFAALAQEASEDSSAARGGDLGFFRRGLMVPPFEAAAFSLQPGEVSEIVETQFGFHVIKVEERQEAGTRPFEEAREDIVTKLKKERAQSLLGEKADAAHSDLTSGKSLGEIAAADGLEAKTTGPLSKADRVAGVSGAGLLNAAFALAQPGTGPVVSTPDSKVLFRVTEKMQSEVPALDAIREQVAKAARAKIAADKAKETADQILNEAKEKGLEAAAQQHGFPVEESGPVGRNAPQAGSIGASPELVQQAFELTTENPVAPSVYTVDGASVVAVLKQRIPADQDAFESQKAQLIETTQGRLRSAVLTDFVTELRSRADIEIGKGYETAPVGAL